MGAGAGAVAGAREGAARIRLVRSRTTRLRNTRRRNCLTDTKSNCDGDLILGRISRNKREASP